MSLAVGDIVEGKVTGITKFGACVELPDNKVGMVHISELSEQYVKEISDFLEKGQLIKSLVMSIDEEGKISLSVKRAGEDAQLQPRTDSSEPESMDQHFDRNAPAERKPRRRSAPNVWQGPKTSEEPDHELSFEEKMARFKQQSDSKLSDLKHANESKHGGYNRRGGGKRR
ncbi:MAG: S1 RNA-binding domain-containing protein [Clostridia bacterium]|nr:S1 RNA-binding domain-containing protein [Clostridia bacterium]